MPADRGPGLRQLERGWFPKLTGCMDSSKSLPPRSCSARFGPPRTKPARPGGTEYVSVFLALVPALFGLYDFVRFRRYFFHPDGKKVMIEGFNLSLGRFKRSYAYAEVKTDLVARWVFSGRFEKRYFTMFYFAGIQVAFFSSPTEAETRAKLESLRINWV